MADDYRFDDENRPDDMFRNPFGDDEDSSLDNENQEEKEVKVIGVYEPKEQTNQQPAGFVVVLKDSEGRSVLIWIGRFEALAISLALEGTSADRPLTHDLLNNIINKMGGRVEKILIDDLWNNTYYAKITITNGNKSLTVDSRPSDAIALSLRSKAPIYMVESVLEKSAIQEE